MQKISARAGLRRIRSMVGQGNIEGANRLAITPGVLKKTQQGSQIQHLGSGLEGTATLVAHPRRGIEVRKVIDPQGVAGPGMVQAREDATRALQDGGQVAGLRTAYNTPSGLRAQHFDYAHAAPSPAVAPAATSQPLMAKGSPQPPAQFPASSAAPPAQTGTPTGAPNIPGVSTSRPTMSPEQIAAAQVKRLKLQGQKAGYGIRDLHEANLVGGKAIDFMAVPHQPTGQPYINAANFDKATAAQEADAVGQRTPYLDYLNDPRRPGNLMARAFAGAPPLIPGSSTAIADQRAAAVAAKQQRQQAHQQRMNTQMAQSVMPQGTFSKVAMSAFVDETMALQAGEDEPYDYAATRAAVERLYPGLYKRASIAEHLNEIAGLGTLAIPSIQKMRKANQEDPEKMERIERSEPKYEVAGLGMLAAPYAHHLATKGSKTYADTASRIGGYVKKVAPTIAKAFVEH